MNELYLDLAILFMLKNYTWNVDGEKVVPTAEDIETAVERAKVMLDEIGGGTLMVGHLIVAKMDDDKDVYDVYVHQGTLGE